MKSLFNFVFVFPAEFPTCHSCFFDFMFGVQRKRELKSTLASFAGNEIQPAETQSWSLVVTVMVKSQIMFSAKSLYLQPGGVVFAVSRV